MKASRRAFSKQFAGLIAMLLGGTQVAGCLGGGGGGGSGQTQDAMPGPAAAAPPPAQPGPAVVALNNNAPVWQSSPAIEFVEGVPSVVSVRQFVQDADQDSLLIALNSGQLLPGITWNPNTAELAYDGRPLGAAPNAPVTLTGLTFSADDQQP